MCVYVCVKVCVCVYYDLFLFSRRFSESELRDLRALFMSLAFQSRSGGKFISASVFQVISFVCFIHVSDSFSGKKEVSFLKEKK